MSQFNTINDFNTYLSEKLRNIKLNEYFNLIQSQFYSDLDISFMDYFLELCNNENEFIVDHIKLQEYGVLNNINTSKDVNRRLEALMLIENEDYLVGNVAQQSETSRGIKYAKEYKLTPYAFKLCLIRSKNSKKYAKYYLLLEQVFKHYQEYQIMYQKVLLSGKNDKIDELIQENRKQSDDLRKQSEQIEELLRYAKDTKEQNEELKETVDDIKEQNEELHDKVDDLKDTVDDIKDAFEETADRSVPNSTNEIERHEFILLQDNKNVNKFVFIRGIKKFNESKMPVKYKNFKVIKREYNANPIQLYNQFKQTMKDNYENQKQLIKESKCKNKVELKRKAQKIKFTGITLELLNEYSLNNLLDDLQNVCNEKFNDFNNFKEVS